MITLNKGNNLPAVIILGLVCLLLGFSIGTLLVDEQKPVSDMESDLIFQKDFLYLELLLGKIEVIRDSLKLVQAKSDLDFQMMALNWKDSRKESAEKFRDSVNVELMKALDDVWRKHE